MRACRRSVASDAGPYPPIVSSTIRKLLFDRSVKPTGRPLASGLWILARGVPLVGCLRPVCEWKDAGWERIFGRPPTANDFIVPTRNMTTRESPDAQKAPRHDLALLELRPRRGHDLRRTFITLAQVDGARKDILEAISHGPRGDIVSVYTRTGRSRCESRRVIGRDRGISLTAGPPQECRSHGENKDLASFWACCGRPAFGRLPSGMTRDVTTRRSRSGRRCSGGSQVSSNAISVWGGRRAGGSSGAATGMPRWPSTRSMASPDVSAATISIRPLQRVHSRTSFRKTRQIIEAHGERFGWARRRRR